MTASITAISTRAAPQPVGHYEQAVVCNGLVHVSGQVGRKPDGTDSCGEPFEIQARQALANVLAILAAAGSSPERVLKVNAYLVGVEHWPTFNRVFAETFAEHRTARTVVPVPALSRDCLIEVDAVAAL